MRKKYALCVLYLYVKKKKGLIMSGINALNGANVSAVNFKKNVDEMQNVSDEHIVENGLKKDTVDISAKPQKPEPPEISNWRIFFGNLTDEQIKGINESGRLPENAKFVMNGYGSYTISNNFFGFRSGTRELPVGFEVKKNVLGFACVLPKGMEGALIK